MTGPTSVTVIIPAVDEEHDIAGCIDAVGAQSWPLDRLEVLVVDGCSTDATVAVAGQAGARHPFGSFEVLTNRRRRTSTSLNVGLQQASGATVVRVDARSRIQPAHVQTCVDVLVGHPEVGVVGGAQVARPRSRQPLDMGIARALNNRWATGLARYRRSHESGPADTVWMGAFRTAELRALGGWADEVALNEDFELNQRYRRAGRTVWYEASLRPEYLPRGTIGALARQHRRYGRVKGLWWSRGMRPEARHLLLLAAPPAAALALVAGGRRRPLTTAMVAVVGLAGVETLGCDGPPAGPAARWWSAMTISAMATSWWGGVIAGAAGDRLGIDHGDA